MKTTQKGMILIEGILIFAIIALIAGTGYYVWHSKQQTEKTLTSAQNENTTSASTKKSTSSSSSSSTTVLKFKEYGVQIDVPDSLKGLTYFTSEGTSAITGKPATFIYLTSDDFKSFVSSCNPTADESHISFAGINKESGVYPTNPTPENSDGALLKQFDGFFIEGSADQQSSPCDSSYDTQAEAMTTKRANLFTALQTAFKTATLTE